MQTAVMGPPQNNLLTITKPEIASHFITLAQTRMPDLDADIESFQHQRQHHNRLKFNDHLAILSIPTKNILVS